jgi:hypothetical protein
MTPTSSTANGTRCRRRAPVRRSGEPLRDPGRDDADPVDADPVDADPVDADPVDAGRDPDRAVAEADADA